MVLHGPGPKGLSKCGRQGMRIADELGSDERINCKRCIAVYHRIQNEREKGKAYIAIEPGCGCVTFMLAAGRESEHAERLELRKIIKGGRRVEVTTVADARKRWTHCDHRHEVVNVDAEVDRLIRSNR